MSAIFLAGLIGLTPAGADGSAHAAICPAAASVLGPSDLARAVRAILRARDVPAEVGACRDQKVVRASLLAEPPARTYLLHIEDPFGRTSDRHVSDAETAASLIESWVPPASDEPAPPAPRPVRALDAAMIDADSAAKADKPRWRLAGALEVAGGSDRSLWYGAALTGCGPLGALCVGGRLRFARDDSVLGPDRDVARSATELLALATLPLAAGRVTFNPGVGVGLGWIRTGGAPGDERATVASDDLGLRLEVAASAALPLGRHLSLLGEVSAARGWSMASRAEDDLRGAPVGVPGAYLRAAIACQYVP